MKRFRVEERVEVLRIYDVIAKDKESAEDKIMDGSVRPVEVTDLIGEMHFVPVETTSGAY